MHFLSPRLNLYLSRNVATIIWVKRLDDGVMQACRKCHHKQGGAQVCVANFSDACPPFAVAGLPAHWRDAGIGGE